ncbi:MAG: Gx transporter family protein [Clostridia bacterium]|nr:Gx transporter family protein [Clostridia bacterium]
MKHPVKRLVFDAILTAVALTIFVIELHIPLSVGVPGVKLGLSNIVTVAAVFVLGPADAAGILLARILLGGIFSGQVMALWYSLAGGFCCYLSMLVTHKVLDESQIWLASVIGAVFHNIGQLLAAAAVTRTFAVFWYFPILMVTGILTGLFTGVAAQFTAKRVAKVIRKWHAT